MVSVASRISHRRPSPVLLPSCCWHKSCPPSYEACDSLLFACWCQDFVGQKNSELAFTYIIIAFSLLIYFNEVSLQNIPPNESLAPFIAGYFSKIGANDVQRLNLPYYFCNFFFLMYYLRCYYVMFWI